MGDRLTPGRSSPTSDGTLVLNPPCARGIGSETTPLPGPKCENVVSPPLKDPVFGRNPVIMVLL
jgi:hypothetical protein